MRSQLREIDYAIKNNLQSINSIVIVLLCISLTLTNIKLIQVQNKLNGLESSYYELLKE